MSRNQSSDAIQFRDNKFVIDPLNCEGCGYCSKICPADAIKNVEQKVGNLYISKIKTGGNMVHARLKIGADNSGKLVAKVKNEAKNIAINQKTEMIIVDGSPGIGCPVVSSLSGADYVVLVTEPTVSGLHDLKRVYLLIKKFKLKSACIINKCDLNPAIAEKIKGFLIEHSIDRIAEIPYDEIFSKAIAQGKTIIEYDENNVAKLLELSWEKIYKLVNTIK